MILNTCGLCLLSFIPIHAWEVDTMVPLLDLRFLNRLSNWKTQKYTLVVLGNWSQKRISFEVRTVPNGSLTESLLVSWVSYSSWWGFQYLSKGFWNSLLSSAHQGYMSLLKVFEVVIVRALNGFQILLLVFLSQSRVIYRSTFFIWEQLF